MPHPDGKAFSQDQQKTDGDQQFFVGLFLKEDKQQQQQYEISRIHITQM